MHISNDHLRLNEIVAATARGLGLAVLINDEDAPADAMPFIYQPTVMAIARKPADFGALATDEEWLVPPRDSTQGWTDDYSNLLGAVLAKARRKE